MKVFSVIGITGSGKTTTVEQIIKGLKGRGYSVGTVKDIHFHGFKMDVAGTNTDRHRQAGAGIVTARGSKETDIMYSEKLSLKEILKHYHQDFVILEGAQEPSVPKILAAYDFEGIEERLDDSVFVISGRISEKETRYKGLPIINGVKDIEALLNIIEEKVFKPLPDVDETCCKACGYNCKELSARILQGKATREDCLLDRSMIQLKIDGQDIPMVDFVQKILWNAVEAVVSELDGYEKNGEIEICIRR